MRIRPETFLRLWTACWAALLVACVWSAALAQTAPQAAAPTNAAPAARDLADRLIGRDFIDSHRSELSFGLDHIAFLQPDLLGAPRWQYVASLLYLLLAFYVSKALDWLIKGRLKVWAARTATRWDDLLVTLADGPVKAVSFVVLFHVGLRIFDWPDWIEGILSRLALVVVAVALVVVCLRMIDFVVGLWRELPRQSGDRAFSDQFLLLVGKLLKAVLIVVATLTLLSNVGVNITALLGSVSVLGLALGLAAQDTVANLFGAVAVFVDKPFKVGDRIRVGSEVDGVVEGMGLRATRVRSLEGFLITLPNKAVGNNTVVNVSSRPSIRAILNYGLTYDTPADRVRLAAGLLREIFGAHPLTSDLIVVFNRFDASCLNLEVTWFCGSTDWKTYVAALEELNLAVKQRFDAERLEFAFPTQTVHLRHPSPGT